MGLLTKTQSRVFEEIKKAADCEGEAFISKFHKWNSRTLKALADKKLVFYFGGEIVSVANHPEQVRSANFARAQNIKE